MTEDDGVLLARGRALRILAARLNDGTCPALEFLDELGPRPRAQFRALLERMADEGKILGEERFRKLEGRTPQGQPEVWEFKAHDGPGWRLYAVRFQGNWLVTHGGRKPRDRRVAAEAARARRICAIYEGRRSR
jgi:putative component of toxin-antitoxin plasmid stabilization module